MTAATRKVNSSPGRSWRLLAVTVSLLVAAIGCSNARGTGPPGIATSPLPAEKSPCPVRDDLLVIAGENPFDARLWQVELCSGQVLDIGKAGRMSVVAVGGDMVAVSAAPSTVDQVFWLGPDGLVPLLPEGAPAGRSPSVSDRGAVLYDSADMQSQTVNLVREGKVAALWRSQRSPSFSSFTPDGGVVVGVLPLEIGGPSSDPEGPTLEFLDADLRPLRTVSVPLPTILGMAVDPRTGRIYLGGGTEVAGLILDPAGTVIGTLPRGWVVNTISASERQLLLTRDGVLARLLIAEDASAQSQKPQVIVLPESIGPVGWAVRP